MDAKQLDAIAKAMSSATNRRRTLGALLGGVLGLLGWSEPEAAKSGACKPACGECQSCQKGTCRKKNGKKTCKRGKCQAKPNGTACTGGKICQGGACICPTACCADTDCGPGQICAAGQCVTGQGTCPTGADTCSASGVVHCNGDNFCNCLQRLQGGTRCSRYFPGAACDQCATDAECLALGFPTGSSCIRDSGGPCTCVANLLGQCAAPC